MKVELAKTVHLADRGDQRARCGEVVAIPFNATTLRRVAAASTKPDNVTCKRCKR